MPTISPPATVLVTGANGYIGLWVVLELLGKGYSVHAAVRTTDKSELLVSIITRKLPDAPLRLTVFVVPDITADGAFDEAVKGVQGVVHTASPVTSTRSDLDEPDTYVRPAVDGTLVLLKSTLHRGENVKRVVITSSVSAIASGFFLDTPTGTYTEETWNDPAVKALEDKGKNAPNVIKYDASKTLAERAAWTFMQDHKTKVKFDLSVINPVWVLGPVADDTLASPSALPLSALWMYKQIFEVPPPAERFPKRINYVDVRDVAEMHVRALELEQAGGERFILGAGVITWEDLLSAAAEVNQLPGLKKVDAMPAASAEPIVAFSNEKSKRVLGVKYRSVQETAKDIVEDLQSRGWLNHFED
ncbi:D-lactaldehyde dehydrogenase [Pilatotrama ljubarskyi]|nr:D-lactaldehyde dehydrogenase [Pilatotrama ljubarskyi]